MTTTPELCSNCFEGHVLSTIGPNRTIPDVDGTYTVPGWFDVPRCDRCGTIWLSASQADLLAELKSAPDRHAMWETAQAPHLGAANHLALYLELQNIGRILVSAPVANVVNQSFFVCAHAD
jgi:hypothetical protein